MLALAIFGLISPIEGLGVYVWIAMDCPGMSHVPYLTTS